MPNSEGGDLGILADAHQVDDVMGCHDVGVMNIGQRFAWNGDGKPRPDGAALPAGGPVGVFEIAHDADGGIEHELRQRHPAA